eukprot:8932260-Pyramimonas_sp.AAC.1
MAAKEASELQKKADGSVGAGGSSDVAATVPDSKPKIVRMPIPEFDAKGGAVVIERAVTELSVIDALRINDKVLVIDEEGHDLFAQALDDDDDHDGDGAATPPTAHPPPLPHPPHLSFLLLLLFSPSSSSSPRVRRRCRRRR